VQRKDNLLLLSIRQALHADWRNKPPPSLLPDTDDSIYFNFAVELNDLDEIAISKIP